MNDALLAQIKAGIDSCDMQGRGIVAVSGGPDSVALLLGLHKLQSACSLSLSVAHLNHSLRGDDSDRDAEFVAQLAKSLDLPCDVEKIDVSSLATAGTGIEEMARNARLDFLNRIAQQRQASWIATAHHQDDQVETLLHHLIRGTGLSGLRGIPHRRELSPGIFLVRPLLKIPRQSLLTALEEAKQPYCLDASNTSDEFTRNRIRHQLLPLLRSEFNPRVDDALSRLASQAAEWEDFLRTSAAKFLATAILDRSPGGCRLRRSLWLDRHPLLQQEALRQLWADLQWPRQNMSASHWQRALDAISNGGRQDFPGNVKLEVRDDLIRLYRE